MNADTRQFLLGLLNADLAFTALALIIAVTLIVAL